MKSPRAEAVGLLAGEIAHDFNNLLTAISSHAGLLLEDLPEGSQMRNDAREIIDACEQAVVLTRKLRTLGRSLDEGPLLLTDLSTPGTKGAAQDDEQDHGELETAGSDTLRPVKPLPDEVSDELARCARIGDAAGLREMITSRVRSVCPSTADRLEQLLDDYAYEEVLVALGADRPATD